MRFTYETIGLLREIDCYINFNELMSEIKEDICVNGNKQSIEIKMLDRNANRIKTALFNVGRGGWVKLYDIRNRYGS